MGPVDLSETEHQTRTRIQRCGVIATVYIGLGYTNCVADQRFKKVWYDCNCVYRTGVHITVYQISALRKCGTIAIVHIGLGYT